jgi:hypothetical protein
MDSFYNQFAAVVILMAVFIFTLVLPDINHTSRLIAGDDVVSYYGLPKPYVYEE